MNMPSFLSFGRRLQTALLMTVAAASVVTLGSGYVGATSSGYDHDDEAEIAKLTVCYALATDAIGRGNLAQGKAIYAPCFTSNAAIAVYNPGTPFNGPPSASRVGTNAWANYVEDVFDASGYVATQHLIGSVDIHVNGNSATMTSYLHATHVLPNGSIDVANGTYEDEVIRQNGTWKIKRRTLKLIDFPHLGDP